jgi:hypothetical protein
MAVDFKETKTSPKNRNIYKSAFNTMFKTNVHLKQSLNSDILFAIIYRLIMQNFITATNVLSLKR